MKKFMHRSSISAMAKEPSRGVFWIVNDRLLAFPFGSVDTFYGVAKSGRSYNHERLWPDVRPRNDNHGYNYYPRGRVEITSKGKPIVYMNPNIDESWISDIRIEFGLREDPKIQYDYSEHYKCHLDEGFKEAK